MNTSAWRLWTICVCQGPGLLPVHNSTHTGCFTPSSVSQRSPHPQGVELIFTWPQGITKRQRGKHGILKRSRSLLCCYVEAASSLCPDGVVSLRCAVRPERRGTCLQKSIKINTCFKAARSSASLLNHCVRAGDTVHCLKQFSIIVSITLGPNATKL